MDLTRLLDEREISRLTLGYASALDDKDWRAFRALFAEEVEIDSQGLGKGPAARMTADAWVERVRSSVEQFDVTVHYNTNQQIDVDGDRARCRAYGLAVHEYREGAAPRRFVVHGDYVYSFRRGAAGWRISGVKLLFRLREGEPPKGVTGAAR